MNRQNLNIFVSHPSHFLTDHAPHGDGLIAYSFLSRLAKRGHELHVAAPLRDLRGTLPNTMHLHPVKTRFLSSPGEQSMPYRLEYAAAVKSLFLRIRRDHPVDVIHQLNPVVLGMSALLYGLGTPVVLGPYWPSWTAPDMERISFPKLLQTQLEMYIRRKSFQRCDAVLSPTAISKSELLGAGVDLQRIVSINVGVDTDEFSPGLEEAAALEPTVLFLANPMRRKGIFVLLDAFELLNRRLPSAHLVIGGSGHEIEEVKKRVQQMPCRDRINLLGHVPRTEVASVMRTSSVYCLPSFGEPFGMSALEAMSCGKPLVVTNTGGLNDLVREQGGH